MYNVEPYVERCLRSLQKQDISRDSYEIICINDGSPDNSKAVVKRLQEEYKNIILIDQENQGVSRARNNGIAKAIGKYLLFIDPDDFVDPNSFGRILKLAEQHDAHVSFLGFTFLNEDCTIRKTMYNKDHQGEVFSGPAAYKLSREDGTTDPDRMWAVLYNRKFIDQNNLHYLPDVPYLEDGELIARIMCLAERCVFDGHSFYQRTTRPGSATNSKLFHTEKAGEGFVLAAGNLRKFQLKQDLNEEQIIFLNQPIVKFVTLAIKSCMGKNCFSRIRLRKRALNEVGLKQVNVKGCNKMYNFFGRIYNFSPFLLGPATFIWPRLNRFWRL
jgi:glycosyltransferase involved in cell wall biosynthesis